MFPRRAHPLQQDLRPAQQNRSRNQSQSHATANSRRQPRRHRRRPRRHPYHAGRAARPADPRQRRPKQSDPHGGSLIPKHGAPLSPGPRRAVRGRGRAGGRNVVRLHHAVRADDHQHLSGRRRSTPRSNLRVDFRRRVSMTAGAVPAGPVRLTAPGVLRAESRPDRGSARRGPCRRTRSSSWRQPPTASRAQACSLTSAHPT